MLTTPTNWTQNSGDTESNLLLPTEEIEETQHKTYAVCDGIVGAGKLRGCLRGLQNFRRLVVRYERYAENFLGMLYLGCCLILLRHL